MEEKNEEMLDVMVCKSFLMTMCLEWEYFWEEWKKLINAHRGRLEIARDLRRN